MIRLNIMNHSLMYRHKKTSPIIVCSLLVLMLAVSPAFYMLGVIWAYLVEVTPNLINSVMSMVISFIAGLFGSMFMTKVLH